MIDLSAFQSLGSSTSCKSKPVGRFLLFMLQVAEPIEQALLGGSRMNWVRFMAQTHHRFGHFHIQIGGNPEQGMKV